MIALALRLALATPRARARIALTALAVAAGVVLVLGAFSVPVAHDQSRLREAVLNGASAEGDEDAGPAILWSRGISSVYDGDLDSVQVVGAAAEGPQSPSLPEGTAVPAPGRMLVSPALRAALREGGADGRLARQFPLPIVGEVPSALIPRPDDLVAIVGQTRASLAGRSLRITTWQLREPARFLTSNDSPVNRVVRLMTPVMILVPILVLVASAARIGRKRRDEQLASLRLIGASTRQLSLFATTEAIVASLIGAALGGAAFALAVRAFETIAIPSETLLGADMVPPRPAIVVAMIGIPIAAAGAVLLTIARSLTRPLAVQRAGTPTRPGLGRFVPLALGWAGLIAGHWMGRGGVSDVLLVTSGTALVLGVVLAGPWLVRRGARALIRACGGRPAALIAARRLLSDSAGSFRAASGIAAAAFVLSAIGVWFAGNAALEEQQFARASAPTATGVATIQVTDISQEAEAARVIRRVAPDAAALHVYYEQASGAAIVFADCAAVRRRIPVLGDCSRPLVDSQQPDLTGRDLRLGGESGRPGSIRIAEARSLPPAAAGLGARALLPLEAEPAGLSADSLIFVVRRVDAERAGGALLAASIPAYTNIPGSYASSLDPLRVGLGSIAFLAFLLGAISLAVGGVDGVLERRRELARLQASGVGVRTLRAATAWELIGPLAFGVAGATLAGLAVGATFVLLPPSGSVQTPLVIPWDQLVLIPLLSLTAGAIVLAATLPALGRAIRPEALRAE